MDLENDHLLQNGKKKTGLNVGMTVFLLAGELIGTGIVTLPYSVVTSGPIGFVLMVATTLSCTYGAITLGRCWNIVSSRYPAYNGHVRDPYPVMGEVCFGAPMRIFVRMLVYLMQFGSGVVVLLLAAEMASAIGPSTGLPFCYWLLILGGVVTPLMLLGSPKDFWQVGLIALLTSIATGILIIISLAFLTEVEETLQHPQPTFKSIILAFSTICFSNSGIPVFPTIQNDMKEKNKFTRCVLWSNSIMLSLFLPITCLVYFKFPGEVSTNILLSLTPGYVTEAAKICLGIHTTLAFLIIINPVSQDFEEFVGIKKEFGISRIFTRTFMMVMVVFIGETVPKFSYLLDVIGGTTLPVLSLVLPSIFYIRLTSDKYKYQFMDDWTATWYQKAIMGFLIVIGIISGAIASYIAIEQMVSHNTFVPPCYVKLI